MADDATFYTWLAQVGQSAPNPAISASALIRLLVNPLFTWVLVLLIIGIAFWLWFQFANLGLDRAIRGVRQGTKLLKERASGGNFTKNLVEINQALLSNQVLRESWDHYTDNLLIPADRTSIRSGREPQYYFNDGILGAVNLNLRFYYAVPSYLVGLGLICTFMGLVAALYFASAALDQDPRTIQLALQSLLKAAAFKFTTSIAGLGSSLVFSYATKSYLIVWQRAVDEFCSTLQELAPIVSSEKLAFEGLAEEEKQTALLHKIHSELANQFAIALDAKLQSNLVRLVDPLSAQIRSVTEKLSVISQDAVKQMVQDFRAELLNASQDQMRSLVQGLQATNESLLTMTNSITSSADHFSNEIGRATQNVFIQITRAAESFDSALHPLNREIASLNITFANVDQRFKSQLNLFTAAIDGMHSTLEEFRKTANVLEGVSTPIHNATVELDAVARRIQESNQASMNALDQLAQFSSSLNKTAQLTRETWDVYRQRFEKVDEDLKGVVEQLGKGFRNYHDIVENFMKQLDQSLSHSSNLLSSSVQELAETLENIEARTKRLHLED